MEPAGLITTTMASGSVEASGPVGDGQTNLLYLNNGDGTFSKMTTGPVVNTAAFSGNCAWVITAMMTADLFARISMTITARFTATTPTPAIGSRFAVCQFSNRSGIGTRCESRQRSKVAADARISGGSYGSQNAPYVVSVWAR
jgi:hypothetical protein